MRSKSTNNNIASNEKNYHRYANNPINEKILLNNQVQANQFDMDQQETSNSNDLYSIMQKQTAQNIDKEAQLFQQNIKSQNNKFLKAQNFVFSGIDNQQTQNQDQLCQYYDNEPIITDMSSQNDQNVKIQSNLLFNTKQFEEPIQQNYLGNKIRFYGKNNAQNEENSQDKDSDSQSQNIIIMETKNKLAHNDSQDHYQINNKKYQSTTKSKEDFFQKKQIKNVNLPKNANISGQFIVKIEPDASLIHLGHQNNFVQKQKNIKKKSSNMLNESQLLPQKIKNSQDKIRYQEPDQTQIDPYKDQIINKFYLNLQNDNKNSQKQIQFSEQKLLNSFSNKKFMEQKEDSYFQNITNKKNNFKINLNENQGYQTFQNIPKKQKAINIQKYKDKNFEAIQVYSSISQKNSPSQIRRNSNLQQYPSTQKINQSDKIEAQRNQDLNIRKIQNYDSKKEIYQNFPYETKALQLGNLEMSIRKKQNNQLDQRAASSLINKNFQNKNEISGHPYKIIKQSKVNFYQTNQTLNQTLETNQTEEYKKKQIHGSGSVKILTGQYHGTDLEKSQPYQKVQQNVKEEYNIILKNSRFNSCNISHHQSRSSNISNKNEKNQTINIYLHSVNKTENSSISLKNREKNMQLQEILQNQKASDVDRKEFNSFENIQNLPILKNTNSFLKYQKINSGNPKNGPNLYETQVIKMKDQDHKYQYHKKQQFSLNVQGDPQMVYKQKSNQIDLEISNEIESIQQNEKNFEKQIQNKESFILFKKQQVDFNPGIIGIKKKLKIIEANQQKIFSQANKKQNDLSKTLKQNKNQNNQINSFEYVFDQNKNDNINLNQQIQENMSLLESESIQNMQRNIDCNLQSFGPQQVLQFQNINNDQVDLFQNQTNMQQVNAPKQKPINQKQFSQFQQTQKLNQQSNFLLNNKLKQNLIESNNVIKNEEQKLKVESKSIQKTQKGKQIKSMKQKQVETNRTASSQFKDSFLNGLEDGNLKVGNIYKQQFLKSYLGSLQNISKTEKPQNLGNKKSEDQIAQLQSIYLQNKKSYPVKNYLQQTHTQSSYHLIWNNKEIMNASAPLNIKNCFKNSQNNDYQNFEDGNFETQELYNESQIFNMQLIPEQNQTNDFEQLQDEKTVQSRNHIKINISNRGQGKNKIKNTFLNTEENQSQNFEKFVNEGSSSEGHIQKIKTVNSKIDKISQNQLLNYNDQKKKQNPNSIKNNLNLLNQNQKIFQNQQNQEIKKKNTTSQNQKFQQKKDISKYMNTQPLMNLRNEIQRSDQKQTVNEEESIQQFRNKTNIRMVISKTDLNSSLDYPNTYIKQIEDCNMIEFGGVSVEMDDNPWDDNSKNPLGPQTLDPNAYVNMNFNSTQKSLKESNFMNQVQRNPQSLNQPQFIEFKNVKNAQQNEMMIVQQSAQTSQNSNQRNQKGRFSQTQQLRNLKELKKSSFIGMINQQNQAATSSLIENANKMYLLNQMENQFDLVNQIKSKDEFQQVNSNVHDQKNANQQKLQGKNRQIIQSNQENKVIKINVKKNDLMQALKQKIQQEQINQNQSYAENQNENIQDMVNNSKEQKQLIEKKKIQELRSRRSINEQVINYEEAKNFNQQEQTIVNINIQKKKSQQQNAKSSKPQKYAQQNNNFTQYMNQTQPLSIAMLDNYEQVNQKKTLVCEYQIQNFNDKESVIEVNLSQFQNNTDVNYLVQNQISSNENMNAVKTNEKQKVKNKNAGIKNQQYFHQRTQSQTDIQNSNQIYQYNIQIDQKSLNDLQKNQNIQFPKEQLNQQSSLSKSANYISGAKSIQSNIKTLKIKQKQVQKQCEEEPAIIMNDAKEIKLQKTKKNLINEISRRSSIQTQQSEFNSQENYYQEQNDKKIKFNNSLKISQAQNTQKPIKVNEKANMTQGIQYMKKNGNLNVNQTQNQIKTQMQSSIKAFNKKNEIRMNQVLQPQISEQLFNKKMNVNQINAGENNQKVSMNKKEFQQVMNKLANLCKQQQNNQQFQEQKGSVNSSIVLNEVPINNLHMNSKIKKTSLKSTIIINNIKQEGQLSQNKNKKDVSKAHAVKKDLIKIKQQPTRNQSQMNNQRRLSENIQMMEIQQNLMNEIYQAESMEEFRDHQGSASQLRNIDKNEDKQSQTQNINYLIPSNLKQVKKQKKKTIMESTIAPQAAKIKLEMQGKQRIQKVKNQQQYDSNYAEKFINQNQFMVNQSANNSSLMGTLKGGLGILQNISNSDINNNEESSMYEQVNNVQPFQIQRFAAFQPFQQNLQEMNFHNQDDFMKGEVLIQQHEKDDGDEQQNVMNTEYFNDQQLFQTKHQQTQKIKNIQKRNTEKVKDSTSDSQNMDVKQNIHFNQIDFQQRGKKSMNRNEMKAMLRESDAMNVQDSNQSKNEKFKKLNNQKNNNIKYQIQLQKALKSNAYNKTQALESMNKNLNNNQYNPKIIQRRSNNYSESNNERKDNMNGTQIIKKISSGLLSNTQEQNLIIIENAAKRTSSKQQQRTGQSQLSKQSQKSKKSNQNSQPSIKSGTAVSQQPATHFNIKKIIEQNNDRLVNTIQYEDKLLENQNLIQFQNQDFKLSSQINEINLENQQQIKIQQNKENNEEQKKGKNIIDKKIEAQIQNQNEYQIYEHKRRSINEMGFKEDVQIKIETNITEKEIVQNENILKKRQDYIIQLKEDLDEKIKARFAYTDKSNEKNKNDQILSQKSNNNLILIDQNSAYNPSQVGDNEDGNTHHKSQDRVHNYQFGKQIGEGAYAVVRCATSREDGKKYAIKVYDKTKLVDINRQRSVRREVVLLQKMNHPNIVKLIEAFETDSYVYLVMENVTGGSLHSYLKEMINKQLDEEEARRIFQQILIALKYCHSKCIAHRDIKLENILLDENKNVKLIDFGFSTCIPNHKKIRMFCGTPSYMAPQIVQKTEYTGPPADIWASGVLLYALLNGCFPFRGQTDEDLYRRIRRGTYHIYNQKVTREYLDILQRCLDVNDDTRPTSKDLLDDPWFKIDNIKQRAYNEEKRLFKARILASNPIIKKTNHTICILAQNKKEDQTNDAQVLNKREEQEQTTNTINQTNIYLQGQGLQGQGIQIIKKTEINESVNSSQNRVEKNEGNTKNNEKSNNSSTSSLQPYQNSKKTNELQQNLRNAIQKQIDLADYGIGVKNMIGIQIIQKQDEKGNDYKDQNTIFKENQGQQVTLGVFDTNILQKENLQKTININQAHCIVVNAENQQNQHQMYQLMSHHNPLLMNQSRSTIQNNNNIDKSRKLNNEAYQAYYNTSNSVSKI